jgi:hypothetical protein
LSDHRLEVGEFLLNFSHRRRKPDSLPCSVLLIPSPDREGELLVRLNRGPTLGIEIPSSSPIGSPAVDGEGRENADERDGRGDQRDDDLQTFAAAVGSRLGEEADHDFDPEPE